MRERLTSFVGDLYDSVCEPEFFQHLVDSYSARFGDTGVQLLLLDENRAPIVDVINSERSWARGEFESLTASDPRMAHCLGNPNRVVSCIETAPLDVVERAPIVGEFLDRPDVDLRWANLMVFDVGGGANGLFVALRPRRRGPYADDDLIPMKAIAPHVARLTSLVFNLSQTNLWARSLEEALSGFGRGVLLVTRSAQILFANRAAEALLASGSLKSSKGKLTASQPEAERKLLSLIASVAESSDSVTLPSNTLVLSNGEGKPILFVRAWPLSVRAQPGVSQPVVALVVDDLRGPTQLSRAVTAQVGLTPREHETAQALCRGDSVEAAAREMGISVETARSHVKAILAKLGVTKQKDAVLILSRLSQS
ncbi:MAG: helix-turn-helix transcriptional regulator [Alphaproteobacteria bacterium]